MSALFARIWGVRADAAPVEPDLLRALAHLGGYVAVAHAGTQVVGAGVGLFGPPGSGLLHSHVVGVAPEAQGRAVGHAVKLHQRAWALEAGLRTVSWTYDPLVRRNAWLNLGKLGARGTSYLVDFYGDMRDGLNAGQGSDRVLVEWSVHAPLPRLDDAAAADAGPAGVVLLDVGEDDAPRPGRGPAGAAPVLAARVPADIVAVRRRDPGVAREWRLALRDTLGAAMTGGYRLTGVTRSGWYRLEREPDADGPPAIRP